jgi:AcrR family transcriptional regulator
VIGERYDRILESACEVIARRGFHQASIRDIARGAGLSLAGLYHYVGGKDEVLFLVLDRTLDRLIAAFDQGVAEARTPEARLLALIRTHLDFALHHAAALKIINRDHELLSDPQRSEIAVKRQAYLRRALQVLRQLDPEERSESELYSATNLLLSATILLLGMLNGIATRPFVRSSDDARVLAADVGALFLYGFLERSTDGADGRSAVLRTPV